MMSVNNGVVELLNQVRTKAIGQSVDTALLTITDILEQIYKTQHAELEMAHARMSQAQAEVSQAQAEVSQAQAEVSQVKAELCIARHEKALVEERLRIELARRFGRSSEKWTTDELLQAELFNEAEYILATVPAETAPDEEPKISSESAADTKAPVTQEKRRGGRERLPDNLPRVVTRIELTDAELEQLSSDRGERMVKIGEDISERLQMKPFEFFVEQLIRSIYGSASGSGVHTMPVPPQIFPKSIIGDSVIAQIITSKFCDALPFYRQERILARSGITISRQTMARAAGAVAEALMPLQALINTKLVQCEVLCADETRLRVLNENGIKKDGLSYMWVLTGICQGSTLVRFHYGGGRESKIAKEILHGFNGILMCDGYGAYPSAVSGSKIVLAACLSHARRKFHDVVKVDSKNTLAREALAFIAQLYAIERQCAEMCVEDRLESRKSQSRLVFDDFRQWLYQKSAAVLPKSALGRAISYTVDLLPRFEIYLTNGLVPIDNNRAENAIRPFVVGRKNWLFNDQSEGAEVSAVLYSIIETAKANGLEPMHYLNFLFRSYRKFGPENMPWIDLLPRPDLRAYAESTGVEWDLT